MEQPSRSLSPPSVDNRPSLPDGIRIYAVGDIHGRADLLGQTLSFIRSDLATNPSPRAIQVFIGDYIDRGPASAKVLDFLIQHAEGNECVFLKGNHDPYLLEFMHNPQILEEWQEVGGLETLISYGLRPSFHSQPDEQAQLANSLAAILPSAHRRFLKELKSSFNCGDFFFAHAGVKPGIPLSEQREEDLLWIREDFLSSEDNFGKVIVHGHTWAPAPQVRQNRINIDIGGYATGRLACLRIEGDQIEFFIEKIQG